MGRVLRGPSDTCSASFAGHRRARLPRISAPQGGQPFTQTITGTPNNAQQILAALKADNQLVGTILDRDPGDQNLIIPGTFNTTLKTTYTAAAQEVPPEQQPSQQPNQHQGAPAPITQEGEQESEAGQIDQSFEVS